VPKRPAAPHLIAERICQGRGSPSASPDFTPIAEQAFGTRQTAPRYAGACTHAVPEEAMAHSASSIINHWCPGLVSP